MKEKLSDYGINGDDNSKEYSNPKTAVEYLWDKLSKGEFINDPEELFLEAKAMEKEQIKNSYHSGAIDGFNFRTTSIYPNSEKYYNETFKSE